MAHNNGNSDSLSERQPTKKWPVWAGAAAIVALVAGAIGVAIGTSNSHEDSAKAINTVETVKPVETIEAINEIDETKTVPPAESQSSTTEVAGMSSPDQAAAHFNAATSAAAGTPSGIDLNRDGSWDVEIMEAANSEVTVRIYPDGTTQVVDSDREETTGALSQADITKIFDVALTDTSGTIVSLDADDGQDREAFTVEVLSADGTQVTELNLDSNYTIIDREVEGASDYFD